MDYENSERRNQIAMDQRKQAETPQKSYPTPAPGMLGGSGGDIYRFSIRRRIDDALGQANAAIRRAEAARRAHDIIQAHPELADLLDALNEF